MTATNQDSASDQVCVFLWALPRSVSTALTKCMSFVDGVQVWHEPYLYSHHNERFRDPVVLKHMADSGSVDFMVEMQKLEPVLQTIPRGKRLDNDLFQFPWVKSQLEAEDPHKKLIFVKDMAHVLNKRYEYLPTTRKFRHTFLIRDPSRMYPSMRKMMMTGFQIDDTSYDICDSPLYDIDRIYKYTYDLWKYTKEHLDPDAVIIDGTELADHPDKLLPKYFDAIGVPYKEDYLRWDPSPDVITQWKASFIVLVGAHLGGIIKTAVESSCFLPEGPAPLRDSLTPDVIRCVDAAQSYYDEMYAQRLKP